MEIKYVDKGTFKDISGGTYTAYGTSEGLLTDDQTGEVFVISRYSAPEVPAEIEHAAKFLRDFIDTETNEIVHEFDLVHEFALLKLEDPETYNYSFDEFLNNCTDLNGTLDEL